MKAKCYVVRYTNDRGTFYVLAPKWLDDYTIGTKREDDGALFETLGKAAAATRHPRTTADVTIFAVAEDGTETPLPSYEEALAENERLRAIETLNVRAIDASLVRLGAATGAIGPMPDRGGHSSPQAHALAVVRDWMRTATEAQADALRLFVAAGGDPLAAIEAAERRLLEAGGWTLAEPGEYGSEQWEHPKHGRECRMVAVTIARRGAKKGGG